MSTCSAFRETSNKPQKRATWVRFFSNAGIKDQAASYAHIFVKNRIELDMLSELNKEYLREMGITPMGDIISILRHSKTVTDQTVREKIMAENESTKFVAKVNPQTSSVSSSKVSLKSSVPAKAPAAARRVLPEHEGKYKISLPKGVTKKSREILAKHSAMQSDLIEKKSSIFDRLNNKEGRDIDMTDSSSSIFNRLGSYKDASQKDKFASVLKNPQARSITRSKRITEDKILRIDDSYSDDDEDRMDAAELKQVKFSPKVEVRVIPAQPITVSPRKMKGLKIEGKMRGLKIEGIRSRLGNGAASSSAESLHKIRKTVQMKAQVKSPQFARGSKMKSDNLKAQTFTVHSRLGTNSSQKFNKRKIDSNPKNSVFNRLGRN